MTSTHICSGRRYPWKTAEQTKGSSDVLMGVPKPPARDLIEVFEVRSRRGTRRSSREQSERTSGCFPGTGCPYQERTLSLFLTLNFSRSHSATVTAASRYRENEGPVGTQAPPSRSAAQATARRHLPVNGGLPEG
ncbi:hypothetical protein KIN20_031085 [Parelaphostrongylus tenuis]|uniref:Uncharacterized protein n=1 Tax=Parelaphostrongylus tenuis TaxID=148309 RepID=A0AAD5R529_PARTN|nr:hypothetical protein KIN20_031085 [Parelaphostrongylus tenuis]